MSAARLVRASAGALALVALSCAVPVSGDPPPAAEPPLHVKETGLAWAAYLKGAPADLEAAIKHADACIGEFEGAANRKQVELAARKEPIANGVVTDEQRIAVLKHGPVNDVATCYYIKARAAAKLGRKAEAAEALAAAERYTTARCWDPKGWLWSPADAAALFKRRPDIADRAPHEVYAIEGWAAIEERQYEKAAKLADRCVTEFLPAATTMEQALAKAGKTFPVGEVSDQVKTAILANGVLNDVSSCLVIRGQAAEALRDKPAAVKAYKAAVALPRGRCWDPRGWFWSPAEKASDRLAVLR